MPDVDERFRALACEGVARGADQVFADARRLSEVVEPADEATRRRSGWYVMGVAVAVVVAVIIGVAVASRHDSPEHVKVGSTTPVHTAPTPTTPSSVAPTTTGAAVPTLGVASATSCQGCGTVAPQQLTLVFVSSAGDPQGQVDLSNIEWQSWRSPQATASAHAYFSQAGESGTQMLVAFDLGDCGGTLAYRRLSLIGASGTFDPSRYLDVCTNQNHLNGN
jgi:hypothetical protein